MASATFTLRAVDSTAAAFASVKNSMQRLQSTTQSIGATLKGMFGLQALLSAGKSVNAMLGDVEANSAKFGQTTEELNQLTRVTGAVEQGMNYLKKAVVFAASKVLDLKDAVVGVSTVQSAGIANAIRLDRDLPKIDEAKKQLVKLKEEILAIGNTPVQNFAAIQKKILELNDKPKDPSKSDELSNLETTIEHYDLLAKRLAIVNDVHEKYVGAVTKSTSATDDYNFSLLSENKQQEQIEKRLSEVLILFKKIDELIPVRMQMSDVTPEQLETMQKAVTLGDEYVQLLSRRKHIETDLEVIAKKSGEIISSSFEDAILSGQKLGQVLRSLAQDMVRMVFNQLVTQKLATGITGFLNGIGMRAAGGPVAGGTPYIVGEKGPELFVPNGSGSIVPNNRLGSGGGGGGSAVNVTYNIASGVSRAELAPLLENERKRLKAEIPDMVRRGGSYRAAFA